MSLPKANFNQNIVLREDYQINSHVLKHQLFIELLS